MKLKIFAEDKPAQKVFEYQLELADQTILVRCYCFGRIIFCFERKIKIEKRKQNGFTKF